MKFSLRAVLGLTSNTAPCFIERADEKVELLLLEAIRGSRMKALSLGNGIVHGMKIPWDQARRVIEKLKAEGKIDYDLPHNTWISTASQEPGLNAA